MFSIIAAIGKNRELGTESNDSTLDKKLQGKLEDILQKEMYH